MGELFTPSQPKTKMLTFVCLLEKKVSPTGACPTSQVAFTLYEQTLPTLLWTNNDVFLFAITTVM